MMNIQNKKTEVEKTQTKVAEKPKQISKTWEAVLKLQGTGKILDMRAVLK